MNQACPYKVGPYQLEMGYNPYKWPYKIYKWSYDPISNR